MESLPALASDWLERERAKGKAPTTLAVYAAVLRPFVAWCAYRGVEEPQAITRSLLERFFVKRCVDLRPSSLHHMRSVLRSFFQYLEDRKILLVNEALTLELGPLQAGFRRPPSRENLLKLLEAPGTDPVGLRDRALFEVLYSSGIRRAECCALDLEDCDRAMGLLQIRRGKGGKDRLAPIGRKALEALQAYLLRGRPGLKPRTTALFIAAFGGRLKVRSITEVFRRWNRRLGLDPPITPHLLRHACATHLLEEGADVRSVQEILGHANIGTTQIYTHVDIRRLQEKLARIDPRERLEHPTKG